VYELFLFGAFPVFGGVGVLLLCGWFSRTAEKLKFFLLLFVRPSHTSHQMHTEWTEIHRMHLLTPLCLVHNVRVCGAEKTQKQIRCDKSGKEKKKEQSRTRYCPTSTHRETPQQRERGHHTPHI
jgi:hypothetical protein